MDLYQCYNVVCMFMCKNTLKEPESVSAAMQEESIRASDSISRIHNMRL